MVIPCYNEMESLPSLISSCNQLAISFDIRFIFVNNGSTDGSETIFRSLVSEPNIAITLAENMGYGGGIIEGLKITTSSYVGWMHGDLQVDLDTLIGQLENLTSSRLMVKGKRVGRKPIELFFTYGMSLLEMLIFHENLWEINAQPTIFSRDILFYLESGPTDFSFDLYSFVTARKLRFRVIRFPVKFNQRQFGQSSWNTSSLARLRLILRTLTYSILLRKIL